MYVMVTLPIIALIEKRKKQDYIIELDWRRGIWSFLLRCRTEELSLGDATTKRPSEY